MARDPHSAAQVVTRLARLATLALGTLLASPMAGASAQEQPQDPHIVQWPSNLEEDPEFVSPPTLEWPIFACGTSVRVTSCVNDAQLLVFDAADPNNPIGSEKCLLHDPPGGSRSTCRR